MRIDDRFRGDTNPIVMYLIEVENGREKPLDIPTDVTSVKFHFKGDDGVVKEIVGTNGGADGRIEFPFQEDTADAGEYVYDVEVEYKSGQKVTFVRDIMEIKEDVG